MATERKQAGKRAGTAGKGVKRAPAERAIALGPEQDALLTAICRRDGCQPEDLLRTLVAEGLERRREPPAERPDIQRIMALIRRYRSPLELRVEHWRYQDQEPQPALADGG